MITGQGVLDRLLAERGRPLVCAHRGVRVAQPENTIPAFAAAVEAGCDAVELDVHVTADRRLAVIHDATVDRTTDGHGDVAAMTAAQLGELDAGAWRGAGYAGARIPLLDEVLELCRGRVLVLVELKASAGDQPDAPDLVAAAIRDAAMEESALLLAFDHRHLARSRSTAPWLGRVALCETAPSDAASLLTGLDAAALGPLHEVVTEELCSTVHGLGRQVVTWTVNDPERAAVLVDSGVDVVISDDPVRVGPAVRAALRR